MKLSLQLLFITVMITFCTFSTKAQNTTPIQLLTSQYSDKFPKAELLQKQKECDVYALPQDKMKCLVNTNKSFYIPNASADINWQDKNYNMPNACQVYDVIPHGVINQVIASSGYSVLVK